MPGVGQAREGAWPRRDLEGADGARAQVQRRGGEEDRGRRRRGRDCSKVEVEVVQADMAIDSVKNLFAIAELRKRVLFTLGLLVVYRIGGHIPTPGVNTAALAQLAEQARGTMFGLYDMFSGTEPVADDDLRARHHAVHQRVDHSAAADGGVAVPRAHLEGRRARPPQDHAVHALRHDPAQRRAVAGHCHLARAVDADCRRAAAGLQPGLGLPPA